MQNLINYLYKINIESTTNYDSKLIIKSSNKYYFVQKIEDINKIKYINDIVIYMNQFSFFAYKIIYNIYNEIYFKYEDEMYIVMQIDKDYNNEVDFIEMCEFYHKSNNILKGRIKYSNNWLTLWENKIDYLHNHFINNLTLNKKLLGVFYYYLGIAENCIIYLKKHQYDNYNNGIAFVHRRISYPNKKIDFYNINNLIIDIKERDIAGYIKSLYLNNKDYISELEYYLKTNQNNILNSSLLYIRLIYPSIFFDYYESKDSNIKKYFNTKLYENFAKKIYDVISSYINIDKIEYL